MSKGGVTITEVAARLGLTYNAAYKLVVVRKAVPYRVAKRNGPGLTVLVDAAAVDELVARDRTPAPAGWLDSRAAAGLTGYDPGHLTDMAKAGRLRAVRVVGPAGGRGEWRFDPSDLPRFKADQAAWWAALTPPSPPDPESFLDEKPMPDRGHRLARTRLSVPAHHLDTLARRREQLAASGAVVAGL